ncbi:MAG: homocysteine S-methyltransferase [Candidatus Promineifilaceae bacterium]
MNPLQPFLDRYGVLVVDGGLATELEARGADLNDDLWSARMLMDDPALIGQVHADYLWAGADVIISATYQATVAGFMSRGLSHDEAAALIRLAVDLALEARDAYWQAQPSAYRAEVIRPLVAASVGPYAAYLADGSEYTGAYDLDRAGLFEFHRERWSILAGTEADVLACETIPNYEEAVALADLLETTPDRWAWFSFSCRDGAHISDGTPVAACAAYLDSCSRVAAIGVNCTAPRYITSLISEIRSATEKPIIVYPNSGEQFDVARRQWIGESDPSTYGSLSREWRKVGAACIGGCCRTTPDHIRQVRDRFPRAPRR